MTTPRRAAAATPLAALACLALAGCRERPEPAYPAAGEHDRARAGLATAAPVRPPEQRAARDPDEIRSSGVLRVALRPAAISRSAADAASAALERALAEEFAQRLGVELRPISPDQDSDPLALLRAGQVDLAAAGLGAGTVRAAGLLASRPYYEAAQVLVVRGAAPRRLRGLAVCVRSGGAAADAASDLLAANPGLRVRPAPAGTSVDALLEEVAEGRCPATIADERVAEAARAWLPRLRVARELPRRRQLVVAVAPEAAALRAWIDEALFARALTGHRQDRYRADLPELKRRKVLRVITRNAGHTYFIYKGMQLGFDFELVELFAREQGLRVEVVVPPDVTDMFDYLKEGKGDVVAASLTSDEDSRTDPALAFTRPYLFAEEVLVTARDGLRGGAGQQAGGPVRDHQTGPAPSGAQAGAAGLTGDDSSDQPASGLEPQAPLVLASLPALRLAVRPVSSYYKTATALAARHPQLSVVPVDDALTTAEIIRAVADGQQQATIAYAHVAQIEQAYGVAIQSLPLGTGRFPLSWAVRAEDQRLRQALDRFIEQQLRRGHHRHLRRKYFIQPRMAELLRDAPPLPPGALSPYDELLREHAARHGLDWRLLAAQMYQESRFDPRAESWVGAQGLMQIMPRTAVELGVGDPFDPRQSIRGGAEYLARLLRRFEPEIELKDRVRFALASYNAGYGHVADARRLARRLKLDDRRWFGNVERAMLLLERPQYHTRARYGYCRGSEPVGYVSRIQSRYDAYITETDRP